MVARPFGRVDVASSDTAGCTVGADAAAAATAGTSRRPSDGSLSDRRTRRKKSPIPPTDVSIHTRIGPATPRGGPPGPPGGSPPPVAPDPIDPAAGDDVNVGEAVGVGEVAGAGLPSSSVAMGSSEGDGDELPRMPGAGVDVASGSGRVGALGRGVDVDVVFTGFGVGRGVAAGFGVGFGVALGDGVGAGVGAVIVIVGGSTTLRSQLSPLAVRARNQ